MKSIIYGNTLLIGDTRKINKLENLMGVTAPVFATPTVQEVINQGELPARFFMSKKGTNMVEIIDSQGNAHVYPVNHLGSEFHY